MKISHGSRLASYNKKNGYGYVTDRMIHSLESLGYEVNPNDPAAEVQLWYDQPHHIDWNFEQYRVAYHPWESTVLHKAWRDKLNQANEVWTPSGLVAHWYRCGGINVPIHVYPHGVDEEWSCRERKVDGTMRFLHVGGEAKRKGGDLVLAAFRAAFSERSDVSLTMKMMNPGVKITRIGKVTFINEPLSLQDLIGLYHSHHVFVYPSWGEGFGLNPLQAMATGMPTIFTGAWAPYKNYAPMSWKIKSELVPSPWPQVHPGKMFKPDLDDLVDKMRHIADNYEHQSHVARALAPEIHKDYDWLSLTREAFKSLEKRLR